MTFEIWQLATIYLVVGALVKLMIVTSWPLFYAMKRDVKHPIAFCINAIIWLPIWPITLLFGLGFNLFCLLMFAKFKKTPVDGYVSDHQVAVIIPRDWIDKKLIDATAIGEAIRPKEPAYLVRQRDFDILKDMYNESWCEWLCENADESRPQ